MSSDYFRRHLPVDMTMKHATAGSPAYDTELAYLTKLMAKSAGSRYAITTGRLPGCIIVDAE